MMTSTLPALERPWATAVRSNSELLLQIQRAMPGPCHLIHPSTFAHNYRAFQQELSRRQVQGKVYYGKKANKASAWLREIALLEGAVDVASVPEFVHALANGIRGDMIGVTGAAKSDELIWLAAQHGATLAIDALDELERAITLTRKTVPLRILLRVQPENSVSRFGFNSEDLKAALHRCHQVRKKIIMEGFSFHLDGYAVEPRAQFAFRLLEQVKQAREAGFPCSSISIGGGFACRYVSEEDWARFNAELHPGQFHAEKKFERFYPYFQGPTGASMLGAILDSTQGAGSLAEALRQADVALYLEPGRALLDGAGLSLFPVQGYKRIAEYGMVTVAGLSMSLSEQWKNSEFLPDPVLVQMGDSRPQVPVMAAIGGASCMEYDVLTWRKIRFPTQPRYGDLIAYPNTAGYQMDKNESEFHQLALPPKLVITEENGKLIWRRDQ